MSNEQLPTGCVIGLLRNPDGIPCTEADSSPTIRFGKRTTLSSNSNDKGVGWDALDIESIHEVTVERSFYCRKADFPAVSAWLASLNGNTYNAGIDGQASINGVFSIDGEIEMTSHSPTLGLVRSRWIGYILDVNYKLPPGMTWEQESETTWLVKMNGNVVLRVSSSGPGDRSGLMLKGGAPVAWRDLPAEIQSQVKRAYANFPQTAAECTDGRQYYEAVYRPIILSVNGEEAFRWWVLVYADGYSTKVLRCRSVYYGTNTARSIKLSKNSSATAPGTVEDVTVEFYVPSPAKAPTFTQAFGAPKQEVVNTLEAMGKHTLADAVNGTRTSWVTIAASSDGWNLNTMIAESRRQVWAYAQTYRVDGIGPVDFEENRNNRLFYSDKSVNTLSLYDAFNSTDTAWTEKVTQPSIATHTVYSVVQAIRDAMVAVIETDPTYAGVAEGVGWKDTVFNWSFINGNAGVSKNFIPLPATGIFEPRYNDQQALANGKYTANEVWKAGRDTTERTFTFRDFFQSEVDIWDEAADEYLTIKLDNIFKSCAQTLYSVSNLSPEDLEFTLAGGKYTSTGFKYFSHIGYVFFEDEMSGDQVRNVQNAVQLYWEVLPDGKVRLRADHKLAGPDALLTLDPNTGG